MKKRIPVLVGGPADRRDVRHAAGSAAWRRLAGMVRWPAAADRIAASTRMPEPTPDNGGDAECQSGHLRGGCIPPAPLWPGDDIL